MIALKGDVMLIMRKVLVAVAASLVSFASAVAYADSAPTVQFDHSATVHFTDLNLERSRDVARLYERITQAADKLCGPRSLTGAYYKSAAYANCYADAVGEAVARVNQPSLTSYYRQRLGEQSPRLSLAR